MGADGVMVIPPFYSSPTDDELFEHYRRIGEAISLPIMVYNNPATANVDLTPPIVARLSRASTTVRYIKESTLEVTRVRDIIELCGDRMTVFAGILGYESFWLGAQGWVAVCSNLIPRDSARLFELVADARDIATAPWRCTSRSADCPLGRRPSLCGGIQGRAWHDGPAGRRAARAAPSVDGFGCRGLARRSGCARTDRVLQAKSNVAA